MKPILDVRFFCTDTGAETVREWLKDLPAIDRKTIGEDIKTVQFGWPLGMPLVGHLGGDIWEVRIKLEKRIARVLFALDGQTMVLLNGLIKKQQTIPKPELDLAIDRLKQLRRR
jgi:phage-related protein